MKFSLRLFKVRVKGLSAVAILLREILIKIPRMESFVKQRAWLLGFL